MINLHAGQSEVFEDLFIHKKYRYSTVCCSRGWGKSYMAATAAVTAVSELLELDKDIPNKFVYIVAPTFDQVKDIYFPLLNYDLGMEDWTIKPASRDLGRFEFENRVELRLLSYESVERMRGKGAYFVVWDEVSSCYRGTQPQEAWRQIIKPAISTRWSPMNAKRFGASNPGRGLIISTPKGYNFFYDMCHFKELDDQWGYYHFDYHTSPFLDPSEIERDRQTMDPIEFASEYLASFEESGNSVFYCFNRKDHVRQDIEDFSADEIINVGIDFNVGVMASTLFADRGKQLHFIDEIKGVPDTETLAITLKTRFPDRKIHAYPDPTGKARKSSAPVGRTDFTILESYGIKVFARNASPPIADSVQAVNRKLKTASGAMNMFFHPRMRNTIASMERTKWVDKNPDSATIDKSEGIEHFSDSVRYPTEYLYPVVGGTKRVSTGFKF